MQPTPTLPDPEILRARHFAALEELRELAMSMARLTHAKSIEILNNAPENLKLVYAASFARAAFTVERLVAAETTLLEGAPRGSRNSEPPEFAFADPVERESAAPPATHAAAESNPAAETAGPLIADAAAPHPGDPPTPEAAPEPPPHLMQEVLRELNLPANLAKTQQDIVAFLLDPERCPERSEAEIDAFIERHTASSRDPP